jgi:tetratricopeptide (TPR) repeat protein
MENKDWNKAMDLFTKGEHQKALPFFNKALEALPTNTDLLNDRAVCYFHLEMHQEALADLNTAVQTQPDYGYRYASRAYIKSAMKDYSGAMADYKKAIELDPEDAIAYNNLGMLEEQMGWNDQAQERFKVSDELAGILKDSGIEQEPPLKAVNMEKQWKKEKEENQTVKAHLRTAWNVFASKNGRKEFFAFLKNGFNLGKDSTDTQKENNR